LTERNLEEIFPKNYLTSVACEIRFDPLLMIQNKIPEFQEKIRGELPLFGFESIIPVVEASITTQYSGVNQWMFRSKDKTKTLKIVVNRIGFIVSKYSNFSNFYPEMIKYFNDFFKICNIDKFSRIGLRYVNEFKLNEFEDSQQISLEKFFNVALNKALIEEYSPFQFGTTIRSERDKYKIIIRNEFNTNISGESNYIIDIDAFKSGILEKKKLETVIKELHILELQEFHRNITDEVINILKRG